MLGIHASFHHQQAPGVIDGDGVSVTTQTRSSNAQRAVKSTSIAAGKEAQHNNNNSFCLMPLTHLFAEQLAAQPPCANSKADSRHKVRDGLQVGTGSSTDHEGACDALLTLRAGPSHSARQCCEGSRLPGWRGQGALLELVQMHGRHAE